MSDMPATASTPSPPPRTKSTKLITWAIIAAINVILFIIALNSKPVASVYAPVSVVIGVLLIVAGIIVAIISIFKKSLRRYGMLTTLGVAFFILGMIAGIASREKIDTGTSGQNVASSPGLPSAVPTPVAGQPSAAPTPSNDSIPDILGRSSRISSVKYDMVVSLTGQPQGTTKIWIKGNKIRAEETTGGQANIYIQDGNRQMLYIYRPVRKYATKEILSEETADISDYSPGGAAKRLLKEKPVLVGSEKIDGKDSLLVEATDEDGQKYKAWVWKEYGFIIRVEIAVSQGTMAVEWKNIEFVDNADSLFELPAGVPVTWSFRTIADAFISYLEVPQGSSVYGLAAPFLSGTDITIRPDFSTAKPIISRTAYPTYFFFIDDAPTMRFNHPVRYVLFEDQNDMWQWTIYRLDSLPTVNGQDWEAGGNITVKGKTVTILMESQKSQSGTSFGGPIAVSPLLQNGIPSDGFLARVRENLLLLQTAHAQSGGRQVAIVIDGSEQARLFRAEVRDKFYRDAEGMAGTLRTLGYNTQFYSGQTGTSTLPLDSKGVENQITALSRDLLAGDSFVLYLGGHGNSNGFAMYTGLSAQSELLFGKGESMVWYSDLANWLAKIKPGVKVSVYIDACESGGAVDDIKRARPGTTVITATDDKNLTPVGIGGEKSFTDQMLEGFQGKAIDIDRSGKIDPEEAAYYATIQNNRGGAAGLVMVPPGSTSGPTPLPTPRPVIPAPQSGGTDLTVTSVSFSPASGRTGQSLSVTFTIRNNGSASGAFSNRISLATTQYGTNYSLGNFSTGALEAETSRTITVTTTPIPSGVPAGSYWVTVFTDGFQQITESNENNNIGSSESAKFTLLSGDNVYQIILNLTVNQDGTEERSYERIVTKESVTATLNFAEFRLGPGRTQAQIETSSTGNTYQYNGSLSYYRHPEGPRFDSSWVLQSSPGGQFINSGAVGGYASFIPVSLSPDPAGGVVLRATDNFRSSFRFDGSWRPQWDYLYGPYSMLNYTFENIFARDRALNPAGETVDISGSFTFTPQYSTRRFNYAGTLTLKLLRTE